MAAHVRVVQVPDADRRELQRRARDKSAPARVVERARIVLLAADEVPGTKIATMVGCAEGTVVTWRGRYAEHGLAGLEDLPRPGWRSSSLGWASAQVTGSPAGVQIRCSRSPQKKREWLAQ